MTIDLLLPRSRHDVAWVGREASVAAKDAFVRRGFSVQPHYVAEPFLSNTAKVSGLAAVVFSQEVDRPNAIVHQLIKYGRRLLDFDCHVIARLADGVNEQLVGRALRNVRLPYSGALSSRNEGEEPLPNIRLVGARWPWEVVANFVAEHPCGPPPAPENMLNIEDRTYTVAPKDQLLIRRAFHDCSRISLMSMDEDGRSGVRVYKAFPELRAGQLGRWPTTFFVKVGSRSKILREYENYEARVDPYIPFNLGPHLVQSRCCLGARDGIIVGDYIDESESLANAARQGRAAAAIACLFDRTLFGWYRTAERKHITLPQALTGLFPKGIATDRLTRARELGATTTLRDLRNLFFRCTKRLVLTGMVHGDLHARNVRVRATDAIVIDFAAHSERPLLFDAATLEASLLIDGFGTSDRSIEEWLASVMPLYTAMNKRDFLPHCNPDSDSWWAYSCIHQIRRFAATWECGDSGRQYPAALALALLIKATKDENLGEPEASYRAAAYVLAERVLVTVFGP